MNAIQFIKDHGVDKAREVVEGAHVCPAHYEEWKRLGQPKFWERDQ